MQKKWKKTGAALLIAGLTVTGAGYAWADEKASESIDLSEFFGDQSTDAEDTPVNAPEEEVVEEENPVEVVENEEGTVEVEVPVPEAPETPEADEDELPEIPEGYTAGNLEALGKAYEKVQNPTAKAAIKRNMERSIEKFESKQSKVETPEQPVEKEEADQQESPTNVEKGKAPQAQLNAEHREQRQELKAKQKAEREALKAERKAEKAEQKQKKKEHKN